MSKSVVKHTVLYLLLVALFMVSIGPFLWLVSTSLKGEKDNLFKYPPDLIPRDLTLENIKNVFQTVPIHIYFLNSLFVAVITVLLNVFLSALAAFPLARMDFLGKKIILIAILSTMMIPFQVTMIPIFILATKLGLKNTYTGLILPNAVTAFGIFLLRQAFLTIPKSMEEAAVIDGCGSFQILTKILLPLIKPFIATLAVFTFVNSWGNFLWPLLMLDEPSKFTLPIGVQKLQGTFITDWRLIASGAVLSMIPIIIFFASLQRYFVEAGATQGIKE